MQTVMIDFPGHTTRFNKPLLKNVVNDIKNKLLNIEIKWYKCKPPLTIMTEIPKEYYPSDIEDANMVIVKQNGFNILVSFSYKSGGGKIFIYEENLSQKDMEIVSDVFKKNGFFTPKTQKRMIKTLVTGLIPLFIAAIYFRFMRLELHDYLPLELNYIVILFIPTIILLVIGIIFLIKGWKIYSKEKRALK